MVQKRTRKAPKVVGVTVDMVGENPFDITRDLGALTKLGFKTERGAIAGLAGRFMGKIRDSKLEALKKLPGVIAVQADPE